MIMIRNVFIFLLLGASLVLPGQTVLAASVQVSLSKDVDAGTPDSVDGLLITITSPPPAKTSAASAQAGLAKMKGAAQDN